MHAQFFDLLKKLQTTREFRDRVHALNALPGGFELHQLIALANECGCSFSVNDLAALEAELTRAREMQG